MLFLLLSVGRVGARVEPGQVVVLGRHDGSGDQEGGAGKKIRKHPQIFSHLPFVKDLNIGGGGVTPPW